VARDRQRAKQRRQRPSGSVRAGARPASGAAAGQSDPRDLEDVVDTGATPAPDPLKHASAEVDEARLAEAGAVHPDVEDDLRAPDAVEGDLVPEETRDEAEAAARGERERGRVLTFLRHCIEELRRVQWPDRRQVGQATAVVLGFVILAGGYLGLMDAIFQPLVNALL
jgi:preprotein translocase SecE subunit